MQLNPFHKSFRIKNKIKKMFHSDNAIVIRYDNVPNEFAKLCQKYETDKWVLNGAGHNYADFYEIIFSQKRKNIKCLLECGIGTINPSITSSMAGHSEHYKPGASLRAWQDYFYNAQIIGVDIDADTLFSEERIKTYQCNQTNAQSICDFLKKVDNKQFDIVIDDGLHKPYAGIMFFENCISRLADDGIYIIEDVSWKDFPEYKSYFAKFQQYQVRYINLYRHKQKILKDNSVIMITKKP